MPELVVSLKQQILQRVVIESSVMRIGRDENMDLCIPNPAISRHHATLIFDGDSFYIEDAGSENGVFFEGVAIDKHRLVDGDVFFLGKFAVRFLREGGVGLSNIMTAERLELPLEEAPSPSSQREPLSERAHNRMGQSSAPPPDSAQRAQAAMKTIELGADAARQARVAADDMIARRIAAKAPPPTATSRTIFWFAVMLVLAGGIFAIWLMAKNS